MSTLTFITQTQIKKSKSLLGSEKKTLTKYYTK